MLLFDIVLHDQSHLAPSSPSCISTIVELSQGRCPFDGACEVLMGRLREDQQIRLNVPFNSVDTWKYLFDSLLLSVTLVRKGDGKCKCLYLFPNHFDQTDAQLDAFKTFLLFHCLPASCRPSQSADHTDMLGFDVCLDFSDVDFVPVGCRITSLTLTGWIDDNTQRIVSIEEMLLSGGQSYQEPAADTHGGAPSAMRSLSPVPQCQRRSSLRFLFAQKL